MTSHATSGLGATRDNPWLDLIRALAIVLVLLRHGERALVDVKTGAPDMAETMFLNGWVGVDLFFVLSGYLIAAHLIGAGLGSESFSWRRYLARRGRRILPAYFAVLLLTVLGVFPLFAVSPDNLPWRIGYHVLMLQDYLPADINVVFWSLGVEAKFYLIAPLLVAAVLACRTWQGRAALLAAMFLVSPILRVAAYAFETSTLDYYQFWQAYRSPFHTSLEGFAIGIAVALAERSAMTRRVPRTGALLVGGSFAILMGWLASAEFMATIDLADVLRPSAIALLAGAMTLGAVHLAGTPMPGAVPVQGLARVSYSLYLVHFPLIPAAAALTGDVAGFWAAYLALSLVAAIGLYFAVERPFLNPRPGARVSRRTLPASA